MTQRLARFEMTDKYKCGNKIIMIKNDSHVLWVSFFMCTLNNIKNYRLITEANILFLSAHF